MNRMETNNAIFTNWCYFGYFIDNSVCFIHIFTTLICSSLGIKYSLFNVNHKKTLHVCTLVCTKTLCRSHGLELNKSMKMLYSGYSMFILKKKDTLKKKMLTKQTKYSL